MQSMKESSIRDYISKIDFQSENWSLDKMKNDLKIFLGEYPAIDVTYKKDVIINEILSEAKEIKSAEKISIVFTDTDDTFKKIDFIFN